MTDTAGPGVASGGWGYRGRVFGFGLPEFFTLLVVVIGVVLYFRSRP